jgi:hypothetical protein
MLNTACGISITLRAIDSQGALSLSCSSPIPWHILIRAVLGRRVRSLLEEYEDSMEFFSPDVCFEQVREHLPAILEGRGLSANSGLAVLKEIELLV